MKIFVTGISGLLGVNLAAMMRDRAEVTGCYFRNSVRLSGVSAMQVDLGAPGTATRVIGAVRPDVVVHTAGLTGVDDCEAHPALAECLNVGAAIEVASAAARHGAKLVHISSDHVFAGTSAWHSEDELPQPLNTYARTKAEAERGVLEVCPTALVVRTNFYGWGNPPRVSFSDWVLAGMREGRELAMFTDVFFTPILINDFGEALLGLISAGVQGIYHVAGSERLSKYEFAHRLADVYGIREHRIRPASVDAARLRASRPKDMSLRTEKAARVLGRRLPTADEGLQRLHLLERQGWRDEIARSISAARV